MLKLEFIINMTYNENSKKFTAFILQKIHKKAGNVI